MFLGGGQFMFKFTLLCMRVRLCACVCVCVDFLFLMPNIYHSKIGKNSKGLST